MKMSKKFCIFSLTLFTIFATIFVNKTEGNYDVYEIPVLILAYYPDENNDGLLDPEVVGNETGGRPVNEIKTKVADMNQSLIETLETGSTYHGYKDSTAIASLNFTVRDNKSFDEAIPISKEFPPFADHMKLLNNLNICDYVENKGVKEIWIWMYHSDVVVPIESNMSGPYGDISNSYRQDDLPHCTDTYTVYNYNYGRGVSEATENHMHQIEHVLNYVDGRDITPHDKWKTLLFWGNFVGSDISHKIIKPGCGWTHYPPNGTTDYDWRNPEYVESDCEDWKPDGIGEKQIFNCDRWSCDSLTFFKWWMQNLPGFGNNLYYEGKKLKNWWSFLGDFDFAMQNGKSLYWDVDPVENINDLVSFDPDSLSYSFTSDTDGIILFMDDFNDGNNLGWTTTLGEWDATLGYNDATGLYNGRWAYTYAGNASWNNYTLDVDITFGTGNTEFIIAVRVDPSSSPDLVGGRQYYLSVDGDNNVIRLRYTEEPSGFFDLQTVAYNLLENETYHIRISIVNNNLVASIDGNQFIDYTFYGGTPIYSNGAIAIGYQSDDGPDGAYFDNVIVKSPGCPTSFAGKFSFDAALSNISDKTLSILNVKIDELTNNNLLLTTKELIGEGDQFQVLKIDDYSDGYLNPDEYVNVPFTVCIENKKPFQFYVDVFGTAMEARIHNPDNGHWYQRFDDTMTWHDAKNHCESMEGYLATITSQSENDFVYNKLVSISPNEMVWIGATDETQEGIWEWINSESWEYTNWDSGEPNNCSGIEHYLVYFTPNDPLGRAGLWNDLGEGNIGGCGCGGCLNEWYPTSTICEWDNSVILNPDNGHYYQLVEVYGSGLSWYEARDAAAALSYNGMPGYLATVTSAQEDNFIANTFPRIKPEYVWLGATDEANEGDWQWITGEPWNYTNWDPGPGEPNGGTFENCLDYDDGIIKWNDANCGRRQNFYLVEYE